MNERIELLENGNTLITVPVKFHYEDGRKRIFFAGRPDDPPRINEQLITGIVRAYCWQEQLKLFGMA